MLDDENDQEAIDALAIITEEFNALNKQIKNAKGDLARAAADAKKAAEANAEMEALNAAQQEFDRLYVQYGEAWEALNMRKGELRSMDD